MVGSDALSDMKSPLGKKRSDSRNGPTLFRRYFSHSMMNGARKKKSEKDSSKIAALHRRLLKHHGIKAAQANIHNLVATCA